MKCQLLGPESSLWQDFLSQTTHDFYHLPRYVQLSARDQINVPGGEGEPVAFLAEEDGNRFFLAMLLRPIPTENHSSGPLFDAATPYGFAGPLVVSQDEPTAKAFMARAIACLKDCLKERGAVSAFVRLHPLISVPLEPLGESGTLVQHGQTVYLDLTLSNEELWHQTRNDHRNGINKAKRKGFIASIDSDWVYFEDFLRAYTDTMHRVGAAQHYFFTRDYFRELRDCLGDSLHLCICRFGDDIVCGGLFTETCGIVQYHLSGTRNEFINQFPMKLILDYVRGWAKERGNRLFHLGGGVGATEDSLFCFKAGFSKLRTPFYTWRLIIDENAYASLIRDWESSSGQTASSPEGFFPAYRAIVKRETHDFADSRQPDAESPGDRKSATVS